MRHGYVRILRGHAPSAFRSSGVADSLGVTDAIRQVLSTYPIWLTPSGVRDLFPSIGFDATHYKHPLTSIHSILRRLVATGEVVRTDQLPGATGYMWAKYLGDLPSEQTQKSSDEKQELQATQEVLDRARQEGTPAEHYGFETKSNAAVRRCPEAFPRLCAPAASARSKAPRLHRWAPSSSNSATAPPI